MTAQECSQLLLSKNNILIITHTNPDGDTLCSAAALCSALRRAGKRANLFRNPAVTTKYMPHVEKYFAPKSFKSKYIVSVDVATEKMFAEGFDGAIDLCIDHHPTNSHYAKKELVCPDKAACGEIVLAVIKEMCGGITQEEADLLYIAVTTDTGCFQYLNTNAATFRAAAELLEYGADTGMVNVKFFRKASRARLKLEGMIYSTMGFYRDGKISVAIITKEMLRQAGAGEEDCDDLAGLAGRAEGASVNITIRERDNGSSKVSVRTGRDVSSSDICAVFGGGGHAMAAGCTIDCPPEKARDMLLAVIDEVWK
ncbi:MAG: DHH family phosphoesterase [Oscillospiraceae bacterium]